MEAFESVCLSRLTDVPYVNKIQKNTTRVGNVVKEAQRNGCRQEPRAPLMLQCVYLMSGVWVPSSTATEKCCKSHRRTPKQRERDKARPILGPEKLPTKALSAPLVPAFNQKVKKLESARQGCTEPSVTGSDAAQRREAATSDQPGINCLNCHYDHFSGLCSTLEEQERASARVAQWRQVIAGSGKLTVGDEHVSLLQPPPYSCSPPN